MKAAKRAARRLVEGMGYTVFKTPPPVSGETIEPEQPPKFTGIDIFPLAVAELISRKPDIFFIQVGAHDGLTYDPMRPFVERHHWRGILLEPQPKVFAKLVENYKGVEGLIFENAAIAPVDGEVSLYTFGEGSDLPEHASQLASFNRDALVYNGHGYKGEIVETRVAAISFASLLKKHGIAAVDILQVDTEGYDYEVIKMIDFTQIKPAIINYEHGMQHPPERNACIRLLADAGYRIGSFDVDTVALLQDDYRAALTAGLGAPRQN